MDVYNLSKGMDGPRFGVKNKFGEIDPRGGVGWVLIAMDGNAISNIGRNKSGIRNTKNQKFEFSECWKRFQSAGTPSASISEC